ncbi:MAG: Undecaprenyl-diphosphatase [uncultured Rubrobacteraceae bacterium]|uniref:Undecaprenyl-diphosphatase n=1 Tax=uncultured Rubrobacteraceae bacterium TaxID=349277 RepID=A0A6J4NHW8_9ACTN|nr:MAG: Undecaprenyl-diphosphatase [uncultured Rubrobacteraceae bacterium]
MVNKLAKGIARAGRAAVLVVGLAVVLALVLGVATTALAGRGWGRPSTSAGGAQDGGGLQAEPARCVRVRPRAGGGAGAGRLALGGDDNVRAVPMPQARGGGALLVPDKRARDGGRGGAEAVGEGMGSHEAAMFLAGSASSAVVGYRAIRFLLRFLADHTLRIFAYYRFALAAVVAVVLLSSGA